MIGRCSTIRAFTVIYAGTTIGDRFQTGHHTIIREDNILGDDCSVGSGAILECTNRIGNRVRIHTHVGMELATIADDVFVGPGARFLDDPHAPCPRSKECIGGPRIEPGAVIGADSTVLPGVTVGARAVVASGSVVTKNVAPETVVAGNPARLLKRADEVKCFKGFYSQAYLRPSTD